MHTVRPVSLPRHQVVGDPQKAIKTQLRRIQSKPESLPKKSDSESEHAGY